MPEDATAAKATTQGYTPEASTVTDKQTVQGQIESIIDSGSPLMERAEANARRMLNQRGLINSTAAVNAGLTAVLDAAVPIAAADAQVHERAATATTAAQNRALEFGVGAKNTAACRMLPR